MSALPRRWVARSTCSPGGESRLAMDPADPRHRVGDLVESRQRLDRVPDPVEAIHPDLVDYRPGELGAVAVLAHLGLQPEQPANRPVQAARTGPSALEPLADRRHAR